MLKNPHIQLTLFFNADLGLKSVVINDNETGLPSDSVLLKRVAITILEAISLNYEDVKVQDLLNELGIERSKKS